MLFGSSGIRARFDRELLWTAFRAGAVLSRIASAVVVGRDTRLTGPVLQQAMVSGLLAAGVETHIAGIAPTPSIAYSARFRDAGAMITASHNPEEYNGVKMFNPDGSSFGREQQKEIERFLGEPPWSDWKRQGSLSSIDALSPHAAAILDRVECGRPITMVLDCGNGAGSVMSPNVLQQMGVRVIPLNCNPAGRFSRPSEPLPEHLPYLGAMIRESGASGAIVHDGDADRMVAWDARGRPISGDHLMLLFVSYLGVEKVVTTMDASMAIDQIAEVQRTPVGDAYVSEELRRWGEFGAEPSGTWIVPEISYCPDGIFAAALFCEMVTEWNIEEEIDRMPQLVMLRDSIPTPEYREILQRMGATNPTDGIRIEKEHGWILIRASGTEPKVRITVEGDAVEVAKELLRKGRAMLSRAKQASR